MIKKHLPALFAFSRRLADMNVIKKNIPDLLAILVIALMVFMMAGQPAIKPAVNQAAQHPVAKSSSPAPQESKIISGIHRVIVSGQAVKDIKERNIFMENGVYADADGKIIPDNPYALIAVLQGKEKNAIFRDYQGKVMTLRAGEKLMDGFVITGIDAMSVRLQRRNELKSLRLFNAGGNGPASAVDKDGAVPKNLYTLMGILSGKEKKAVFKDFKGSVSILSVGATLLDGSVITYIHPTTVQIKKDGEKSELKIFSFRDSEETTRKKK